MLKYEKVKYLLNVEFIKCLWLVEVDYIMAYINMGNHFLQQVGNT